jgi:hypothetical protein
MNEHDADPDKDPAKADSDKPSVPAKPRDLFGSRPIVAKTETVSPPEEVERPIPVFLRIKPAKD